MTFRLGKIVCAELVGAKGRQIPSVRAVLISDNDQEGMSKLTRGDEDLLLAAMLEQSGRSIVTPIAVAGYFVFHPDLIVPFVDWIRGFFPW